MVAAVEKQKAVYVMNRDATSSLTISSPLEAHKAQTVVFDVVALDVGFDNPTFAALELDYAEADQDTSGEQIEETEKMLTYYELDLGLNHVTRRWSEPVARTANLLCAVPGGGEGPSGVLVCGENWVAYKHEGHAEVRAPLPRRVGFPPERGLLVTCAATHRQRELFFFLVQSELGDMYKVTLDVSGDHVHDLAVSVFDALFPAAALCITRTGLLYAGAECGDHALFQFRGVGDEAGVATARAVRDPELGDDGFSAAKVAPKFVPENQPRNLTLLDEPMSLCAATDVIVADLAHEGTPQLYALCGRGPRSSLRVLRHGVAVAEVAVSPLPGRPSAVWTVRGRQDEPHHRYIIVSFTNATLVLSVGETVEEVTDSGFLASAPTLEACLLADNALLQVHAGGIRHVGADARVTEWKAPGARHIERAASNERQVAVCIAGGEVIYFELDAAGSLAETATKPVGVEVACIDIAPVPPGRARAPFLALGGFDASLRLWSLAPDDVLTQIATLQLGARPEAVRFIVDPDVPETLQVCAGLVNGVLQRAHINVATGGLGDARARFLGNRAVRLFHVTVRGEPGILALSSRAWLGYHNRHIFELAPLSYDTLEYGASFSSEQCPDGIVAIAGASLRIFVAEKLGETFNQSVIPLRYTPRKLCVLPASARLLVVEADQHQYNEAEKAALAAAHKVQVAQAAPLAGASNDMDMVEGDQDETRASTSDEVSPPIVLQGPVPPTDGKWASCVRVVDASSGQTLELLELGESEAALSCSTVTFAGRGGEVFVAIGTARGLTFHPRTHRGCYIHVYRLLDARLVLLHRTQVEDVPLALAEFRGRLLVAIGPVLRLYDLGKRKLLRKTETRLCPTLVVRLEVLGDRIFVADAQESVHFARYVREHNKLAVFADESVGRCCTASVALDYDTVAVADKFGNISILRLPTDASDDVDDPTGARLLWDAGIVDGAPNKLQQLAHYHVGDLVTQMRKSALVAGGAEGIVFVTVSGAVGALVPSASGEDKDFFTHLEMHMRQELVLPTGRDHVSYRSYYMPVRDVTDGDLCALFSSLPNDTKKRISADLDRTPTEVAKKLDDARNRLL
jgi:splicing factor 3B subunit 3